MPYVKQDHPEKECKVCSAVFKPNRAWQEYCSDECRIRAQKGSQTIVWRLTEENRGLKEQIKNMAELVEEYKMRQMYTSGPARSPFKYDDEDQSKAWGDE